RRAAQRGEGAPNREVVIVAAVGGRYGEADGARAAGREAVPGPLAFVGAEAAPAVHVQVGGEAGVVRVVVDLLRAADLGSSVTVAGRCGWRLAGGRSGVAQAGARCGPIGIERAIGELKHVSDLALATAHRGVGELHDAPRGDADVGGLFIAVGQRVAHRASRAHLYAHAAAVPAIALRVVHAQHVHAVAAGGSRLG